MVTRSRMIAWTQLHPTAGVALPGQVMGAPAWASLRTSQVHTCVHASHVMHI